MFNKILALLFIFIFNSNALADSITTFKCRISTNVEKQPLIVVKFLIC